MFIHFQHSTDLIKKGLPYLKVIASHILSTLRHVVTIQASFFFTIEMIYRLWNSRETHRVIMNIVECIHKCTPKRNYDNKWFWVKKQNKYNNVYAFLFIKVMRKSTIFLGKIPKYSKNSLRCIYLQSAMIMITYMYI